VPVPKVGSFETFVTLSCSRLYPRFGRACSSVQLSVLETESTVLYRVLYWYYQEGWRFWKAVIMVLQVKNHYSSDAIKRIRRMEYGSRSNSGTGNNTADDA